MTTANALISSALAVICSLSPGEPIPGGDASNALAILNMMLAAWSADSLMPPFRTLESFPLIAGQSSYTIGPSANFNTVRPDYISGAWRRDSNGLDYILEQLPKERYNAIWQKSIQGIPYQFYYDDQYPVGVIYLYPTDIQADTLFIESLKPLNQFSTLNTIMNLPGEYEEAIAYLLAKRLAPQYGFPITADIRELMDDAERRIKRKNTKPKPASFDYATRKAQPFNIYNG